MFLLEIFDQQGNPNLIPLVLIPYLIMLYGDVMTLNDDVMMLYDVVITLYDDVMMLYDDRVTLNDDVMMYTMLT